MKSAMAICLISIGDALVDGLDVASRTHRHGAMPGSSPYCASRQASAGLCELSQKKQQTSVGFRFPRSSSRRAHADGVHEGQRFQLVSPPSGSPLLDKTRNTPIHPTQPTRTSVMTSITPFLWLDNNVPEAVAFYKSVFPNAKVETVNDFMAAFELEGQKFNALNGGPKYKFNEAISFFISVETQEEVDYFWDKLTANGGKESQCGWLKDKFGLSWQVVPTALGRYLGDPDRKKADRAMQAMMKMQKIIIADLDNAFAG
jgi:predicted 3-demethylubiquinone-9 3-methyltransferase (glyoxalase superfamily)